LKIILSFIYKLLSTVQTFNWSKPSFLLSLTWLLKGIEGSNMKKHIFSILLLSSSILVTGCVEEYKTETVMATVIEKKINPTKTFYKTVLKNGKKVQQKVNKPTEYEVKVQYKDLEKAFINKKLYYKVNKGELIKVHYLKGLNKKGNVVSEKIKLID